VRAGLSKAQAEQTLFEPASYLGASPGHQPGTMPDYATEPLHKFYQF